MGRRRARSSDDRGFSLIEVLVAMGIVLVVTGAIFSVVNPSQGVFRVQPEVSDMHQRMRVAVDRLSRDLLMAGAGPYSGPAGGALTNFFAPVGPYRTGRFTSAPGQNSHYRPDAISLLYVPDTASQTTIRDPMAEETSAVINLNAQPGCPLTEPLCGFGEGQVVLISDDTGAWDTGRVTGLQASTLHVQHRGQLARAYEAGAQITVVEAHSYYLDPAQDQLRHDDGWGTDLPLVDNVVDLQFRYFGDADPPTGPNPRVGAGTCLFDANGNPRLAQLGPSGTLVELTETGLTDGPWCTATAVAPEDRFDADLYRVRKVRVTLRIQAAASDMRGSDAALFMRPGQAKAGARLVPDYVVRFEIAPRNMNLDR